MESQMNIMDRLGEKQVGRDITVLTEGFDRYAECWFGRSAMDAPDIDGKVFFSAETKPYYGEMVTVHVDEAIDGDLFGTRCLNGRTAMNLPNKLTILRIILVPFFVLFMLLSGDIFPHHNLVALAIFGIASYTDHLGRQNRAARSPHHKFRQADGPLGR